MSFFLKNACDVFTGLQYLYNGSYRRIGCLYFLLSQQSATWSFTIPTACMYA